MITEAQKFTKAIDFIANKQVVSESDWNADDLLEQELEISKRAFWSAKVENARFLQRAKDFIQDRINNTVEEVTLPDGEKSTRLKAGGRADFVRQMRDFMVKEGMAKESDFRDAEGITDIRSEARLKLIYDTNLRMAYGYGQWLEGNQPMNLYLWPAQELYRSIQVTEPRPRHEESIGDVRLKTDWAYWADYQNDPEIGGFGLPFPPFGFNSGMAVKDVSRDDAAKKGLDVESIQYKPANLNEDLKASVKTMDKEGIEQLQKELESFEFKTKVTVKDDEIILDEQEYDNLFYDDMLDVLAIAAPMMGMLLGKNIANQLQVRSLLKNGAATKAGIKKGDIISKVNGKKVKEQKDLLAMFKGKKPGEKVDVELLRGKKTVKAKLTLKQVKGIIE